MAAIHILDFMRVDDVAIPWMSVLLYSRIDVTRTGLPERRSNEKDG